MYFNSGILETGIRNPIFSSCNFLDKMTEKLCLQWNDFKENATSAFGILREDNDFADVTLACEDGEQFEAHKVNEPTARRYVPPSRLSWT